MRVVRYHAFETNSSSVHSLCISKEEPKRYPNKIKFESGIFDQRRMDLKTTDLRASYLYEMICSEEALDSTYTNKLKSFLDKKGIKYKFPKENKGYIGHSPDNEDIVKRLFENTDLLNNYLFSERSFVQVGSDSDEEYMVYELLPEKNQNNDDIEYADYFVINRWN